MAGTQHKRPVRLARSRTTCGRLTCDRFTCGRLTRDRLTRGRPTRSGPTLGRSTPGRLARGSVLCGAIAMVALLLVSSCGYSPSPTLSSSIKRIYIPTFENETAMYGIEQDLTQVVAEAFTSDNRLTVVSERDADVMLRGVIVRYEKGALTFDRAATVDEFRVSISISVVLEDLGEGKVLWEDDTMNAWEAYNETEEGAVNEDEATAKVMITLADDIVSRTIEGW